jgi:hypothetical protein
LDTYQTCIRYLYIPIYSLPFLKCMVSKRCRQPCLKFAGPTPNVDIVLSICLQSDLPTGQSGKTGIPSQLPVGPAPATSELSGSSKSHPVQSGLSHKQPGRKQYGKRKQLDSMCIIPFDYTSCLHFPLPFLFDFGPVWIALHLT